MTNVNNSKQAGANSWLDTPTDSESMTPREGLKFGAGLVGMLTLFVACMAPAVILPEMEREKRRTDSIEALKAILGDEQKTNELIRNLPKDAKTQEFVRELLRDPKKRQNVETLMDAVQKNGTLDEIIKRLESIREATPQKDWAKKAVRNQGDTLSK